MPISRLVVFHGYAETPDWIWFPWLKVEAAKLGLEVICPSLPDPLLPDLKKWKRATREIALGWGADTIVVGHSLGGVLALRHLADEDVPAVAALITVGSPYAALFNSEWLVGFFNQPINWDVFRAKAPIRLTLASDNDPLIPIDHARRYVETLGSEFILTPKNGHYMAFKAPEVLAAIKAIVNPT